MTALSMTDNDTAILAALTDHDDPAAAVQAALEAGASLELMRRLLANWCVSDTDGSPARAQPYAGLVRRLRGDDFARELLQLMCVDYDWEYDEGHYHRAGFWADPEAWALFGTEEQALTFAQRLAIVDPDRFTMVYREQLTAWFEPVGLGLGYVQLVLKRAAAQLRCIDTPEQLDLALTLSRAQVVQVASRCPAAGLSLVLMGYALARYGEGIGIGHRLVQQLKTSPHYAPLVWRWVAEGYRRAFGDGWYEAMTASYVQQLVTSQGWRVAELSDSLVAHLPTTQRRPSLGFQHDPNAQWRLTPLPSVAADLKHRGRPPLSDGLLLRAETLQPGDRVLVHHSLADGRVPRITPAGPIYPAALMPAAPPDAERLACRSYWYAGPLFGQWRPGLV